MTHQTTEPASGRAELINDLCVVAKNTTDPMAKAVCEVAAAMLSSDAKPVRDGELPPLPEPDGYAAMTPNGSIIVPPSQYRQHNAYAVFTADQMRDYARAAMLSSDAPAGGEAGACSCAECGKTSTKDSMWALYCLDCIQEHSIGGGFSLRPGYERLIDEYIENYEFTDGDAGYHDPSEFEQAMIKDAFMGFDFSTIYTHPQPARTAEPLADQEVREVLSEELGMVVLHPTVMRACFDAFRAAERRHGITAAAPKPQNKESGL